MNISELESLATQVRRDILRMIHAVNSGHPGGSLGCTDYLVALYGQIMQHNPKFEMDGRNEDLFFLSNGHVSALLYSVLARCGYFDIKELGTFRKLNTRLQGHPTTHDGLPGVRIASGSLGQGMSVACGAAYAKKMNNDNRWVYSLHGDGELQEGQIWEAAQFAAHHQLDNLIAAVDWNGQQIDGPTEKVMANLDLAKKFEAFGWHTILLEKGNDMASIIAAITEAKNLAGQKKPIVILMKTTMGFGVDFMMKDHS